MSYKFFLLIFFESFKLLSGEISTSTKDTYDIRSSSSNTNLNLNIVYGRPGG